jgi:cytosine/uracil/thiamine/allantoin permease
MIVGSILGSLLLALRGRIGSDHVVPSLISIRTSFGRCGAVFDASGLITTINLLLSGHFSKLLSMSVGSGIFFFSALDLVVALPVS